MTNQSSKRKGETPPQHRSAVRGNLVGRQKPSERFVEPFVGFRYCGFTDFLGLQVFCELACCFRDDDFTLRRQSFCVRRIEGSIATPKDLALWELELLNEASLVDIGGCHLAEADLVKCDPHSRNDACYEGVGNPSPIADVVFCVKAPEPDACALRAWGAKTHHREGIAVCRHDKCPPCCCVVGATSVTPFFSDPSPLADLARETLL
jgi:hypothetical protein